ncbi:MAG TPA: alpha/beta hydrolase family protein [Ruminiclostridium sp.]
MALIHCDFYSETLGMSTSMCVILPENTERQIGMQNKSFNDKHPTLYLLHGMSDDHTIWLRRTSIERYVATLGLAVVMPCVSRGFYTDMVNGYKYWTFISEELPMVARSFFPLSEKREDNFAVGLSMGGYGAFKLALQCPDKFAAGASLSGCLDIVNVLESINQPEFFNQREYNHIFGSSEKVKDTENDLFYLLKKFAGYDGYKPKLYQCCGTEDFLYKDNKKFLEFARKLLVDLTYEEEPGSHEWAYWDYKIQKVLQWLPIKR